MEGQGFTPSRMYGTPRGVLHPSHNLGKRM